MDADFATRREAKFLGGIAAIIMGLIVLCCVLFPSCGERAVMRIEGTVEMRDEVVRELEKLKSITSVRAYLERLIELQQKYPRPYRAWRAKRFDPKTGQPVAFGWKSASYNRDLFAYVYTHRGFCQELPRSKAVDNGLRKLANSRKSYALTGFVVSAFFSDYNGGTELAGLQISPLFRPEEL